jgi:hypothetical protein
MAAVLTPAGQPMEQGAGLRLAYCRRAASRARQAEALLALGERHGGACSPWSRLKRVNNELCFGICSVVSCITLPSLEGGFRSDDLMLSKRFKRILMQQSRMHREAAFGSPSSFPQHDPAYSYSLLSLICSRFVPSIK